MDKNFYDQALRGLSHLYESCPRPVDIEFQHLESHTGEQDSNDSLYGTLKWLRDNEFIYASWIESVPLQGRLKLGGINAQLTQKALHLMDAPEQNLGGRSIGRVAVDSLRTHNAEWKYVLEIFQRRMLVA